VELKTGARVAIGATSDAIWISDGTNDISMLRPVLARGEIDYMVVDGSGYSVYVSMDLHPGVEPSFREYQRRTKLAKDVALLLETRSFPPPNSAGTAVSRSFREAAAGGANCHRKGKTDQEKHKGHRQRRLDGVRLVPVGGRL